MKQAHERTKFYNEMRLRRIVGDIDLISPACQWQHPSIICFEPALKARVIFRELMSEANSIEIELNL